MYEAQYRIPFFSLYHLFVSPLELPAVIKSIRSVHLCSTLRQRLSVRYVEDQVIASELFVERLSIGKVAHRKDTEGRLSHRQLGAYSIPLLLGR